MRGIGMQSSDMAVPCSGRSTDYHYRTICSEVAPTTVKIGSHHIESNTSEASSSQE